MYTENSAIFNPRDLRYKTPYGAVESGTVVCFALRPQRLAGFSIAAMKVRWESRDNYEQVLPMPWCATHLGEDEFTAQLDTKDYVGLVWYSFTLQTLRGEALVLGPYQLTVYAPEADTCDWFGAGITYQIFPDRFHRTCLPNPANMVGNRTVHENWLDMPDYLPDEHGEIRNRDFFGGNLAGIMEKLDYLAALGVQTLYLNPIFEAAENHRYGTADYHQIDPMLGCNDDFTALCTQAHQRGMRVILDGVFNHTGFVSRYFNGDGFYPDVGAAQSENSPYRPWFQFQDWPNEYSSWWGIYSLPAVDESCAEYRNFIFGDENSVVRRWLRAGADGWRLDVADELPDDFIAGIHAAAKAEKSDAIIIGEVWEDGSTKIAYDVRRKHILGGHCDSLMNYPLRNAILAFVLGGDGADFMNEMETLRENYPKAAFFNAMNFLGTHDTPRILTVLGVDVSDYNRDRGGKAAFHLSEQQRTRGVARLKAAALLLYCFVGSPTIYYGDEIGMQGFEDPFNRQSYPWGNEDRELLAWFIALGQLRRGHPCLQQGEIAYLAARGGVLAFTRTLGSECVLCAINAGAQGATVCVDNYTGAKILLGEGALVQNEDEGVTLTLPPCSGSAWLLNA